MKNKKILIGMVLVLLLLLTTGLSYAYFSTAVKGNDNTKDVVVEAGTLKLTYTDGPAINVQYIKPGWSTTKEVSVKNNGTLDAYYNVIWQSLTNGITNDELVLSATCQRLNSSGTVEGTCDSISQAPIRDTAISKNISIESGVTHKYTFTILFKETNANQNYNQGKEFNGVLGIEENKEDSSNIVNCTYNGELTQGATFTQGNFTYHYKEKMYTGTNSPVWSSIDEDGWGVILTNPNLTESIDTSEVCTYINSKPIISMSGMFVDSKSTSINLSKLNTSNAIYMDHMFENSIATVLNLESFDTSNVTDMSNMFSESQATTINLSNFDTSNVTDMRYMFAGSQVSVLNLSNFDTRNVTDMSWMFAGSEATTINLSNFDTSNVTDMRYMFVGSQATTINLSNFDTRNVAEMSGMFNFCSTTILDLSSFDTSNVVSMEVMFADSNNLKTIYASDKFKDDNISNSEGMFSGCTSLVGGAGTAYDEDYIDFTYARIDGGQDEPGYFTAK